MSMNKRAALFYAKRGWPVFPVWSIKDGNCTCGKACNSPGKHPIAAHNGMSIAPRGFKDATTNLSVVSRWWGAIPDANIGCVGLKWFALDVDDQDSFEFLIDNNEPLPDTLIQYSGGGGTHYLFKQPKKKIGNWTGKLPKGIDVRGYNGYILMAPSNHVNGDYVWELSSKPSENELAEAPAWLVDIIGDCPVDKKKVSFGERVTAPDLAKIGIPSYVQQNIMTADHDDRSSMDQTVVNSLVSAGLTNEQIREIYMTYPIGIEGKYAEKGAYADRYLATTISKARSYVGKRAVSQAIPGKIITLEEAETESGILKETYQRGWNDALLAHPEIAMKMWPKYLGMDDERLAQATVAMYDIGVRMDFKIKNTSGEFAALTVPITNTNHEILNVDYSIYRPPSNQKERAWENSSLPVFISDHDHIGRKRLVVVDDWDIAAYLYITMSHELPDDIAIVSLSSYVDVVNSFDIDTSPLLELAEQSEEVIFVRYLLDREQVKRLSYEIGREKTSWVGWPMKPRDMFKSPMMNATRFSRALRGAIPII